MRRRTAPTAGQIAAALAFQDVRPRTARAWLVHWTSIEPTVIRYQEPVTLDRVLDEHRGAVAAEPLEPCPAGAAVEPQI